MPLNDASKFPRSPFALPLLLSLSLSLLMTTTSTQTIELRETSLQHRHHAALEHGPEHRLVDPLRLVSAKKSEHDIKQKSSRKVRNFYRRQNDLIDHILGPLNPVNEEEQQRQMLKVGPSLLRSIF